VELTVGNSDTLTASVRSGDLDVALLGLREESIPRGVALRLLAREQLVAAVPRAHRLVDRARLELRELSGQVFADFPAGTSGRAQSDMAFTRAGVTRDVAFEADSAELILGLVSAGLAVTLLAPGVVARSRVEVASVAVVDGPIRVEYAAWDGQAPRNVARAFLAELDAMLPSAT